MYWKHISLDLPCHSLVLLGAVYLASAFHCVFVFQVFFTAALHFSKFYLSWYYKLYYKYYSLSPDTVCNLSLCYLCFVFFLVLSKNFNNILFSLFSTLYKITLNLQSLNLCHNMLSLDLCDSSHIRWYLCRFLKNKLRIIEQKTWLFRYQSQTCKGFQVDKEGTRDKCSWGTRTGWSVWVTDRFAATPDPSREQGVCFSLDAPTFSFHSWAVIWQWEGESSCIAFSEYRGETNLVTSQCLLGFTPNTEKTRGKELRSLCTGPNSAWRNILRKDRNSSGSSQEEHTKFSWRR